MTFPAARLLLFAALGGALPACAGNFRPDSLADGGRTRRRYGCLEAAFGVGSISSSPPGSIVVRVRLGNRCRAPAPVDLTRLSATAFDREGRAHQLRVSDPRREIRPATVEARSEGEERLRFLATDGGYRPARLCFDVSSIGRGPPSQPGDICVELAEDDE